MSGLMLSGVATKYGKTSGQYLKAGGSLRKRRNLSTQSPPFYSPESSQPALSQAATNGSTNGNGTQPKLSY